MSEIKSLSVRKMDFEKISRRGKSFKEGLLILKKIQNESGKNRFAISVSKKVSKKATVRNKVKRRIRSILKKQAPGKDGAGADALIIALPGTEKRKFDELEKEMQNLLKKAKIGKNA